MDDDKDDNIRGDNDGGPGGGPHNHYVAINTDSHTAAR